MDRFYPSFPDEYVPTLGAIFQYLEQDPGYLEDPECPFSEDFIEFLSKIRLKFTSKGPKEPGKSRFFGQDGDKWSALEAEAIDLFEDLKEFGETLTSADAAQKMGFFRTRTSLLERIVAINERAMGLKTLAEFQSTVLEVLEDVLTPDQRTQVMVKLRASIGMQAPSDTNSTAQEDAPSE